MHNDWAYNEMQHVKVWDPRCQKTLICACQRLAEQSELSFSRALGSQRKAVSPILHHETTRAADLLEGHIRATNRRCQNYAFVLLASDTTVCDFTTHHAAKGLGPISSHPRQQGFLLHSVLALTPQGDPLGLLHQQSWVRDPAPLRDTGETPLRDTGETPLRDTGETPLRDTGETPLRDTGETPLRDTGETPGKRAFEAKESYKWLHALRGVEAALPSRQKALLVQDREADVFAFFAASRRDTLDLLLRATQPRRVVVADGPKEQTLFRAAAQAPVLTTHTAHVPARAGQSARTATLTLRVVSVTVLAPRNGGDPPAPSVPLQVVRASEETPPAAGRDPIEWVLLTTLPVPDAETAVRVVGYYALRWRIERFPYVLKSGCRLERLQLDTFATLQKAVRLYSIVAWRLLHLTYLAREVPETPCREAISDTERTVLEYATGQTITTVRQALQAVAKIAGFVSVPSAPDPGVKSLWLGFRKLQDMVAGFLLTRPPSHQT